MINFKKYLASFLVFGVVLTTGSQALASETNIDEAASLFKILSSSNEDDESLIYDDLGDYTSEINARADLATLIASYIDSKLDLAEAIAVLNKKAASVDEIKTAFENLKLKANESGASPTNVNKDDYIAQARQFVIYGRVFFADRIDKSNLDSLYEFYEASVNSLSYKNANSDRKKTYDEVLVNVYDLIVALDGKTKEGKELDDEDKANISHAFDSLDKLFEDNKGKVLVNKSSTVKNTGYKSSAEQDPEYNKEDSPFYKNEKTKQAFEALNSDKERKNLDEIDTDKSGDLSDEEIKAAGFDPNNLKGHWLEPFAKKDNDKNVSLTSKEVEEKKVESTSKVGTQEQSIDSNPPTSTASNPISGTPETVTIGTGNNSKTNDKKDVPTNTYASSQAKTGVEGLGFVGIILIVAVAGFLILSKNNKKSE